jgi:transcriptional regulator with XRE-family HTH domain
MRDDALGTNAEHAVRHLFVRGDPAASVSPPTELGKHGIEPLCECGEYELGVEVPDSDPWVLIRHCCPSSLLWSRVAYLQRMTESSSELRLAGMRSAALIREARLRAGLTQAELAERSGRDRSVIARWEQGVVAPSVETLVELVRACGYDLPLALVPYETTGDERLGKNIVLSPERRVRRMLSNLERGGRDG